MRKTRSSHDDGYGKNGLTNKLNQRVNVEDDEEEEDENDEEEEEEITRCVCGRSEYPGMPSSIKEFSKHGSKASEEAADAVSSVTAQEDSGGLFIQCDICKVWQHGGCVGIMDEAMSPEEYFCEQCRKDLHKLTMTANGQKHSIYLPVQGSHLSQLSSAPTTHQTSSKRARDGRASRMHIETIAGKRRSTMNSRDAAYDEAEQLRQAIEESKKYGDVANGGTGNPKSKRRRDESEPYVQSDTVKRRRTDSGSSAASKPRVEPGNDTEDENGDRRLYSVDSKTVKGVPARNPRNKEIREREEKRERERSDAAIRRRGRAERRRGDESDPSEESLSNRTSSKEADQGTPHLPSQIHKDIPSTLQEQAPPPKATHKKTGRPPARRGRQGRNQYTKDREPRAEGPKNPLNAISPGRSSNSREDDRSPRVNAHNNNNHSWGSEFGKPSKPRQMNPNRTTMNDMKRRVAGILEFISHTQVEMAAEVPLSTVSKKRSATANPASGPMTPPDESTGLNANSATTDLQDDAAKQGSGDGGGAVEDDLSQFAKLGSVEMMEILTKKLIKWQESYGEK
ncbi:MAG: hypothetical protein LQ342_000121 [Letrouitia transgressa]|nr:MAG: hypothetical protein LQ342_000121 [Letrouitia transgressa]